MLQVTLLLAATALIISKKNKLHQETMILFELLASNADPLKATSHLLGLLLKARRRLQHPVVISKLLHAGLYENY